MGRLVLTRKEAQGLRFTIKPEHVAELGDLIRDGITITITELHKTPADRQPLNSQFSACAQWEISIGGGLVNILCLENSEVTSARA